MAHDLTCPRATRFHIMLRVRRIIKWSNVKPLAAVAMAALLVACAEKGAPSPLPVKNALIAPVAGGTDVPAQAEDSPTYELVLVGEVHHLGDSRGSARYPKPEPEGTSLERVFTLTVDEPALVLTMDFVLPWGPNMGKPPIILIDGVDLGAYLSQFPPRTDPGYTTNPDMSVDYAGLVHITLPVKRLTAGKHTFRIENGRPDDDYYFENVKLSGLKGAGGSVAQLRSP